MSDPKLFETDGPTERVQVDDPEDVYAKMMETGGMEFGFEVTRADPDPTKTFSKEALDLIKNQMGLWIGTRIVRHFKEKKRGAHKLQVHVTVSLDGEKPLPSFDVPFISWPDGQRRRSGK